MILIYSAYAGADVKLTSACGFRPPLGMALSHNARMRKSDDPSREFERTQDRITCEDDRWYVRTREGMRGPFSKRQTAESEASLFVETMEYLARSKRLPANVNPDDVTVLKIDDLPWR